MKGLGRLATILLTSTLMALTTVVEAAQVPTATQAIVQFQRAADSYAFRHRQVERRGSPAPVPIEGALFEPHAAAAFRERIAVASRLGCEVRAVVDDFEVPRVNTFAGRTRPAPACLVAALPRLPAELEYRLAGPALLVTDVHLQVVVDVLHAALPRRDN
jgi:hypothetical protein